MYYFVSLVVLHKPVALLSHRCCLPVAFLSPSSCKQTPCRSPVALLSLPCGSPVAFSCRFPVASLSPLALSPSCRLPFAFLSPILSLCLVSCCFPVVSLSPPCRRPVASLLPSCGTSPVAFLSPACRFLSLPCRFPAAFLLFSCRHPVVFLSPPCRLPVAHCRILPPPASRGPNLMGHQGDRHHARPRGRPSRGNRGPGHPAQSPQGLLPAGGQSPGQCPGPNHLGAGGLPPGTGHALPVPVDQAPLAVHMDQTQDHLVIEMGIKGSNGRYWARNFLKMHHESSNPN